jgi:hypothetical protein
MKRYTLLRRIGEPPAAERGVRRLTVVRRTQTWPPLLRPARARRG